MYVVPYELAIFDGPPPSASEYDRAMFQELLDGYVRLNRIQLRYFPDLPLLHEAIRDRRVVYVPPRGQDDPWRCIRLCLATGELDCEDGVAWRVAELNERFDVPAVPVFQVGMHPDGRRRMIHVAVGLPNGEIEDISKRAGMR